jgi:L-alanine-DL-glutamate epimerase-like enolase superfamily enzyme
VISRRKLLSSAAGLAGISALPLAAAGRKERLTITKVELFRVCPPLQEGVLAKSAGPDFDKIPKYMLKVHTDSGLVGLGETHRMGGGPDAAAAVQLHLAAEALCGRNVLDFNLTRLELPVETDVPAFEVAFYDIVGKAVGWPVYRLLGGLGQRKVLVNYWCGKGLSPDELRLAAQRAVAGGFNGIKMKRSYPLAKALEIFASVSPKLKITVDLMGSYPTEFLPVVREFEAVGNVRVIEDPPPRIDALAEYHELGRQTTIPIAMHLYINREGVRGMVNAVAAQACSVLNLGAGSMAEFVANSYFAGAVGMPVWHGSAHELGVLDAALLHACAAAPNCTYPSDILSYQRVHNLLAQPIEIRDSWAIVSDAPGLGVELDMDAVRRYEAKT